MDGYEFDYDVVRTLLYAMSVFRFTILIYEGDGPFDIIDKFRDWVGVIYHKELDVDENDITRIVHRRDGEGQLVKLLNCPFCISAWVAGFMVIGYVTKFLPFEVLAIWGGIWGVTYLIVKYDKWETK